MSEREFTGGMSDLDQLATLDYHKSLNVALQDLPTDDARKRLERLIKIRS